MFLQVEDEEDVGFAEGATESKFIKCVAYAVKSRKCALVTFICSL